MQIAFFSGKVKVWGNFRFKSSWHVLPELVDVQSVLGRVEFGVVYVVVARVAPH